MKTSLLVAILALLGGASSAQAGLALDVTSGGITFAVGAFPTGSPVMGWLFDVVSPVNVTGLGFWDEGSNGLANSHAVGIWLESDPSTLLAQQTVTNSSTIIASASGLGRWYVEALPSGVALGAGRYVIGALYAENDADVYRLNMDPPTTIPEIAYAWGQFPYSSDGTLTMPGLVGGTSYWGPNFYVGPAVPEPGTMGLLLGGMSFVAVAGVRRRRALGKENPRA